MAAKRIAGSSIEWAKIAERVPEAQKARFLQFKAKSETYLRRLVLLHYKISIQNQISHLFQ